MAAGPVAFGLFIAFQLLLRMPAITCTPPNIIFIVADDFGWNDVGYHGSEIKTPNMDSLANSGVKLDNYYVQPVCTPSRSQLMSGRYQIHTGLQHSGIDTCQPNGLPLDNPTVADKLREAGYINHMIGKWHLGYFNKSYTPTYRGFDSFIGYYTAEVDYYTRFKGDWTKGVDFQINETSSNSTFGEYSAHLFARKAIQLIENHDQSKPMFLYLPFQSVHDPMQVPKEYEDRFSYIKDKSRRTQAGMVSALDEAIGNVTTALQQSGMWNNTVLMFTTDNGGKPEQGSSNYPLRGGKASYWEGGIRGVGFVSGPLLKNPKRTSMQLMHITDWFPTIMRLAKGSMKGTSPDGFDQWDMISGDQLSPRKEILHNIDPLTRTQGKSISNVFDTSVRAALRVGNWKILTGYPGKDGRSTNMNTPTDLNRFGRAIKTLTEKNVLLFNIKKDPQELHDLSDQEPQRVKDMLERLAFYNSTAVPVNFPPIDKRCAEKKRNGFVGPWL